MQTPKRQEIFMKKQSIALTALTLLASSAAYGSTYNFYFGGCDGHEQRQRTPMVQCHNMAPLPAPLAVTVDDTQKIYAQLGLAVVEARNAFFSRNLKYSVPGEENFELTPPTLAQLKKAAAEKAAAALAAEKKAAAERPLLGRLEMEAMSKGITYDELLRSMGIFRGK